MILEQTQPDPPSGCEPHGCLSVNATGAAALGGPELRLPPLVRLIDLVHLVYLVCLVLLPKTTQTDLTDRTDQTGETDRINKYSTLLRWYCGMCHIGLAKGHILTVRNSLSDVNRFS